MTEERLGEPSEIIDSKSNKKGEADVKKKESQAETERQDGGKRRTRSNFGYLETGSSRQKSFSTE